MCIPKARPLKFAYPRGIEPTAYCGGVEARYSSGRRPAVGEAEMTGDAESDELTEWQGVGWIYLLDVARSISF